MKPIHLVLVQDRGMWSYEGDGSGLAPGLLQPLSVKLAQTFGVPCDVNAETVDAAFAFASSRGQYRSTVILKSLERLSAGRDGRTLGITMLDLFVPVLTFVFGEAQLEGDCALVSLHRLSEEFYGLPPRTDLLFDRLVKEAVHELGHTFGLRHCLDWQCVMTSSHAVERIDVKSAEFCAGCRRIIAGRPRGVTFS